MTQVSEISEQRHPSQEVPKQSGFEIEMRELIHMMLASGGLRKMRVMEPDEPRYVRPPREYDLPEYRQGMPHCASNEKYLRPTRYCNPREPLVIAMANELGAYELTDWEFANAAFWFVKTKLVLEFLGQNSVSETLKRGTGTCYHLISVWLALCRAAGIKARYKTFKMRVPEQVMIVTETAVGDTTAIDMFDTGGTPEGEGEAYIDGKWEVAHLAFRPEIAAAGGLPVTRFGEDAIGNSFILVPGTIRRFESISLRFAVLSKVVTWLAPASMERANAFFHTQALPVGKKILEAAGGIEAYDQNIRRMRELLSAEDITRKLAAERKQLIQFKE
jgi:hypothetical protein